MYWITKNMATSGLLSDESMKKLKKKAKIIRVDDLIDGAGNDPKKFKAKVDEAEKWMRKGKKVVIMCGSGISRSNAIALAYLVWNGMEFDKAYNLIREKVPIVQIDMALLDLVRKLTLQTKV